MTNLHDQLPYIDKYHPLDTADNAVWLPIVFGCWHTTEIGYDPDCALSAWGVHKIYDLGEHVLHKEDSQVGKYTLSDGWNVQSQGRGEWAISDQNGRCRIRVIYDTEEYIFQSGVCVPFGLNTKTNSDEEGLPPTAWWIELSHHRQVVFRSESIDPLVELRSRRENLGEEAFWEALKFHDTAAAMRPLQEQVLRFLQENYPEFPDDPNAYW